MFRTNRLLSVSLAVTAAVSCGPRQELPNLQNRKELEHLKEVCFESTASLYVIASHGTPSLSPTNEKPGARGPADWVEPAGAKFKFTDFEAIRSFDGIEYAIYAEMSTSSGRKVKVMAESLIDYRWFYEVTRAVKHGQPGVDFPTNRPPIDYDFLRVCSVPSPAAKDESGPKEVE